MSAKTECYNVLLNCKKKQTKVIYTIPLSLLLQIHHTSGHVFGINVHCTICAYIMNMFNIQ